MVNEIIDESVALLFKTCSSQLVFKAAILSFGAVNLCRSFVILKINPLGPLELKLGTDGLWIPQLLLNNVFFFLDSTFLSVC